MRVTAAESTELFVGTAEHPHQVVTAEIEHVPGRVVLCTVEGPGVVGDCVATAGQDGTVRAEILVSVDGLAPGDRSEVTLTVVGGDQVAYRTVEFTAAEPDSYGGRAHQDVVALDVPGERHAVPAPPTGPGAGHG